MSFSFSPCPRQKRAFHALSRVTVALFSSACLLTACTTPKVPEQPDVAPVNQVIEAEVKDEDYQSLLTQAQNAHQQGLTQSALNDIFNANALLAEAISEHTLSKNLSGKIGDDPKRKSANQVAHYAQAKTLLANSTQLNRLSLTPTQQRLNNRHLAIALFSLEQFQLADQYIQRVLAEPAGQSPQNFLLSAEIKGSLDLEVETFVAFARYFNALPKPQRRSEDAAIALERLSLMSQWQINSLNNYQFDHLKGWLALYQLAARYGSDVGKLERFLETWQRQHPQHPFAAFTTLVSNRATTNATRQVEQVGVLLPLSGREQAIGKAIQDGILSAYQHNKSLKIHFFDTRKQAVDDIYAQLIELQPDFVIGPILKERVNQYLVLDQKPETLANPQTMLTTSRERNWSTLLLNIPDVSLMDNRHFAFSMQPEDEAIQAAEILSHKGFELPVVITEDSSLGRRIAEAFSEQWWQLTQNRPRVMYYSQNDKMEATVRQVLTVDESRARITSLKRLLPVNLDTESRNRRDIDMFYIYGNPAQVQLLKPYIDVSISPFAQSIPIFSSSHGFKTDTSETDKRDLKGLTFSEMPWLIEPSSHNNSMHTMAANLWPQRKNNMQRLYALGLDSLSLLDKLDAMRHYPVIQHKGYTGILQLDEYNVVRRSLSWANYRNNKIMPTTMK